MKEGFHHHADVEMHLRAFGDDSDLAAMVYADPDRKSSVQTFPHLELIILIGDCVA